MAPDLNKSQFLSFRPNRGFSDRLL